MGAYMAVVEGRVNVLLDGVEPWFEAKRGMQLTPGTQVRTKAGASATLVFSDGTKLRLGPNATFKIETLTPSRIAVYIGLGRLEAWVKRVARRSFQARNPVSVASVRGTVFAMDVITPTQCTIDLFSGSLAVIDNFGRTTSMEGGQRVEADAGGGASTPAALPAAEDDAPVEPKATVEEVTAGGDAEDGGEGSGGADDGASTGDGETTEGDASGEETAADDSDSTGTEDAPDEVPAEDYAANDAGAEEMAAFEDSAQENNETGTDQNVLQDLAIVSPSGPGD